MTAERDFFKGIEHVFWDLDHTLWDYSTNARITIFELYEKHAMHTKIEHGPDVFHQVYCKHNDIAWDQYRKGEIDKHILRQQRFRDTLIELGTDPNGIFDIFEKEFVEICPTKPHLMPGAREVLELFKHKFKQHIITNGFKETQSIKTFNSGIQHYFESVTHSEETGFQKPNPEIFRIALETVGATKENSMMIGDNFEADILGAFDFGMRCVYYNPGKLQHGLEDERLIDISDLGELI